MNEIKVYRDSAKTRRYCFAEGPNKDKLAFTVATEYGAKLDQGVFPYVTSEGRDAVHLHGFKLVDSPKPANAVTVEATCGQKVTMELADVIDEDQTISEVTIRGVRYVPE